MSVAVAHNIASFSMWSSVDFPHKTEAARTFWRRCHTLIKTLFVKRPGLVLAQWDKKNNLKVIKGLWFQKNLAAHLHSV